jgi:electron transfer flavoprotein alpha subunit
MSVLVIAERGMDEQGNLQGIKKATLSAVTFGREISSRLGIPLDIVVLGADVAEDANTLAAYGARTVYTVESGDCLGRYLAMPYGAAVAEVARTAGATWVVMTGTTTGKDLLPSVAVRLEAGLASDVVSLAGDGADFRLVRPMWAGNVLAEVEILTPVKCVTIRGSDWSAAQVTGAQSPLQAVGAAVEAAQQVAGKTEWVEFLASGGDRPELTEADVVVSGGRGLKSEENFHILDELADVFGAAIGATRAAVDSGYAPNDYQVGQTGKSVAPNLYIAVAISGAIQHLAGMKNSKVIVAINKDPDAPIFQVADYGLVADAFQAVPELSAAIRAVK